MVHIDFHRREIALKLVYYGPPLSGKTTNLRRLHERLDPAVRDRLLTLDTHDDRTLFFDLLPIRFRGAGGLAVKLKLFTVPGQVMHNATRRLVLQGADGVAFIADSRGSEVQANERSYRNLRDNLVENGLDPAAIPIILQFNKCDLPGSRGEAELAEVARGRGETAFLASALQGEGVIETFLGLVWRSWARVEEQLHLAERFGWKRSEMFEELARQLGLSPSGAQS